MGGRQVKRSCKPLCHVSPREREERERERENGGGGGSERPVNKNTLMPRVTHRERKREREEGGGVGEGREREGGGEE